MSALQPEVKVKICSICKVEKELSEFGVYRRNPDERRNVCLDCRSEDQRNRRKAETAWARKKRLAGQMRRDRERRKNETADARERRLAGKKTYRDNHGEQTKQANKEYRLAHLEETAIAGKAYRLTHPRDPKEAARRRKEWNLANPERYAYLAQRGHAKARGIEFPLTQEEFSEFWKGCFHLRGIGADDLQMCRFGDCGAYEPNNIYMASHSENRAGPRPLPVSVQEISLEVAS